MFNTKDSCYFIDLHGGIVRKSKFIDEETDGIWIKTNESDINTFVFRDNVEERLFNNQLSAEQGLISLRKRLKDRLYEDDKYISDIISKLKKTEGAFYTGVIEEILHEKLKGK